MKTTRDAIVAVAEGHTSKPATKKAALAILAGRLRGGNVPIEATIEELADRKEADRFIEGFRRLRPMPEELAIDLATAATEVLANDPRGEDAPKAAAVLELFFAATPKSGWSQVRRLEWLDAVLAGVRAATSAKQKDLAKRLSALAQQHAPKREKDVLDTIDITTVRQAIDAVLAAGASKQVPGKTKLARICGLLDASWPPHTGRMVERTIEELSNPAESARFVIALRKLPVPRTLLESLAFAAVERMQDKKVRPTAFPIADLFFDLAPTKPLRKDNRWISLLNNVIYWAVEMKAPREALRFSELAMPHAGANANVPHNAACGFALSKRYDDALEMCRLAVKNGYKDLKQLQTDKLLGPLRDRDDFKALFAKRR